MRKKMSVNQMSSKPTITKDELISLLKAAHQAYPKQPKPPENTGEDWIEWYANYMIEQLQKPSQPTQPAPPAQPSVTPAPPPVTPAQAGPIQPPTQTVQPSQPTQTVQPLPRPSTAKLPENPSAKSQPTEPSLNSMGATSKLEDAGLRKTEPDAGILQVCPTCAHRNRPGVYFCENCGTNLMTGQQAVMGTRDLREAQDIEPNNVREALSEPEQKASPEGAAVQLDKEQEKAVRSAGTSQFGPGMLLRIEVEGGSAPIIIKPKNEDMILGRRDPTTGATPEVDLTTFAGYRMGVSRRHASLALENNQISLWDLGSSNGTYLNGNKLTPHQPSLVRDGDEVRLGQMVLRLFFQNTPGSKS